MTLLSPAESRFPLTRGRTPEPGDDRAAEAHDPITDTGHEPGLRRYGLRFFVRDQASTQPVSTYCERQQVTVDDEGRPVVHGPNAAWERTTTGNMDGNEETKMDQDPDSN